MALSLESPREVWEDQHSWELIRVMKQSQGASSSQGPSVSSGPGMQDAELPVAQDSAPAASIASQDGPVHPQGAEAATPSPLAGLATATEAALENCLLPNQVRLAGDAGHLQVLRRRA